MNLDPTDAPTPAQLCKDCGKPFWIDTVLPDAEWERLCPEHGLLCANCIVERASKLPHTIIVYARIVSAEDHDAFAALKNVPISALVRADAAASRAKNSTNESRSPDGDGQSSAVSAVGSNESTLVAAPLAGGKSAKGDAAMTIQPVARASNDDPSERKPAAGSEPADSHYSLASHITQIMELVKELRESARYGSDTGGIESDMTLSEIVRDLEVFANRLEALAAGACAVPSRMFPIQNGPDIPWSVIEPFDKQCQKNHGRQTLERLAERGGLSVAEALAVMHAEDFDVYWKHGYPTLEVQILRLTGLVRDRLKSACAVPETHEDEFYYKQTIERPAVPVQDAPGCQGVFNGDIGCEREHGHDGACGWKTLPEPTPHPRNGGVLVLNSYGRTCYDAGRASALRPQPPAVQDALTRLRAEWDARASKHYREAVDDAAEGELTATNKSQLVAGAVHRCLKELEAALRREAGEGK